MKRRIALGLAVVLSAFVWAALPSSSQTYPRACFQNGYVIPCPAAQPTSPPAGATTPPVSPPPGGGAWYEHYIVGDGQFRQYEIYLNPSAVTPWAAIPIAGNIRDTRVGNFVVINVVGGDGVTLTLPSQPVATTTFCFIEVNAVTGEARVLTSTVSFAAIIPTSQSWRFVWRTALYAGAAGAQAVGQAVKPQ